MPGAWFAPDWWRPRVRTNRAFPVPSNLAAGGQRRPSGSLWTLILHRAPSGDVVLCLGAVPSATRRVTLEASPASLVCSCAGQAPGASGWSAALAQSQTWPLPPLQAILTLVPQPEGRACGCGSRGPGLLQPALGIWYCAPGQPAMLSCGSCNLPGSGEASAGVPARPVRPDGLPPSR